MHHSPFLLRMHPDDLAAPQCFSVTRAQEEKNPSSRAAQSELFWLSTDISGHRNQLWVLLEKNCPFVNSCQHICRDICTGSLWQGWTFWPFWPNDQADTSWFPGRESKLPRVRYFGIFLDVIGLTFINWGFYWGDRCGLGALEDIGLRSRMTLMLLHSSGDHDPNPWRHHQPSSMETSVSSQLNAERESGDGSNVSDGILDTSTPLKMTSWIHHDIMDTPPCYSQLGECHWLYSEVKTQDTFGSVT